MAGVYIVQALFDARAERLDNGGGSPVVISLGSSNEAHGCTHRLLLHIDGFDREVKSNVSVSVTVYGNAAANDYCEEYSMGVMLERSCLTAEFGLAERLRGATVIARRDHIYGTFVYNELRIHRARLVRPSEGALFMRRLLLTVAKITERCMVPLILLAFFVPPLRLILLYGIVLAVLLPVDITMLMFSIVLDVIVPSARATVHLAPPPAEPRLAAESPADDSAGEGATLPAIAGTPEQRLRQQQQQHWPERGYCQTVLIGSPATSAQQPDVRRFAELALRARDLNDAARRARAERRAVRRAKRAAAEQAKEGGGDSVSDSGATPPPELLHRPSSLIRVATSQLMTDENGLPQLLCCVCLEEPRAGLLEPCGHMCMCMSCLEQWLDESMRLNAAMRCPLCRAEVRAFHEIKFGWYDDGIERSGGESGKSSTERKRKRAKKDRKKKRKRPAKKSPLNVTNAAAGDGDAI